MAGSSPRLPRGRSRPIREVVRQRARAQARTAIAVETALMRRLFGAAGLCERDGSIVRVAAEQEIPAYAAQLEEEYRYERVWELRCPGFLRTVEVAALPDRGLLDWLDRLSGLTVARALAQLDAAPEFASAWQLALTRWRTEPLPDIEQDLLGLVAVELWKRRRPERPCLEVLLDAEFAAHLACLADAGKHLGRYLDVVRAVLPALQGASFDEVTLGGDSASHLMLWVVRLVKLSLRTASEDVALAGAGMSEAVRWFDRLPVERDELREPFARIIAEGLEALGRVDEARRVRTGGSSAGRSRARA